MASIFWAWRSWRSNVARSETSWASSSTWGCLPKAIGDRDMSISRKRAGLVADIGLLIPHQLLPCQTFIPLIGNSGLFPQEQLGRGAVNHLLAFVPGDLGEALIHVHEAMIG